MTAQPTAWMLALALASAYMPLHAQSATRNEADTAAPAATETGRPDRNADRSAPNRSRSSAATANAGGGSGYNDFAMIAQRNIFNGNRSGASDSGFRTSRTSQVRVDGFALVGTIESPKGIVALFDGTDPSFQSTAKPGTLIAGFEVKEVKFAGVRLTQGDDTVDLAVGSGMRRENGGLWKPTTDGASLTSGGRSNDRASMFPVNTFSSPQSYEPSGRNNFSRNQRGGRFGDQTGRGDFPASSSTVSSSSSAATASPVDVNAVLQRLMEQREKE